MRQKKLKLCPLGVKIKARLAELNMTQKQLAELVGMHEKYMVSILYGIRPGDKYIDKMEAELNIKLPRPKKQTA